MIMQPVNVLPTFVSQDADLKTKESSGTSEGRKKDDGFSRLVDEHVDDEITVSASKESKSSIESTAANSGKDTAVNGKNDTEVQKSRQESDSSKDVAVNKNSKNDGKTAEHIATDSEANQTNQENVTDSKALDESEQFISLLYNSDQTLTKTDGKAKQSEQANQSANSQKSPENSGNNNIIDIVGDKASNKESAINTTISNEVNGRSDSGALTDHKLKAFSKDELLARAQLNNKAVGQVSGEQILKDYQQLLQSKQAISENQSISSEQLIKSQLADAQLKNNKITDVAEIVSQANKGKLKEQVDTGLYQLPVEPIGKDKVSTDGQTPAINELIAKTGEKQSDAKGNTVAKQQGENGAQLTGETKEALDISAGKIASNTEVKTEIKNDTNNSQSTNSPLNKTNQDKVASERVIQSVVINENISKEQSINTQNKQAVTTNAQTNVLNQAQAQQKEQVINSELHSLEQATDEYAFEDSMQLSQEKAKGPVTSTGSKVIDSTIRTAAELQAQTLQASQIKQNNDAYIEHQASEVLNHTVASDTAQIQKNNVQLQQETISIFKKDFADAVKDKVMVTINQKLQQFDITLDPPEFGNMQVRVNLQGEQAAVNFVVQNQQAKDALEQNMHKLRDMLAEQGVDVGGANVEQQDQQQNNDGNELNQENKSSSLLTSQEDAHNVEHVLSAKLFDSSATGVDYYA